MSNKFSTEITEVNMSTFGEEGRISFSSESLHKSCFVIFTYQDTILFVYVAKSENPNKFRLILISAFFAASKWSSTGFQGAATLGKKTVLFRKPSILKSKFNCSVIIYVQIVQQLYEYQGNFGNS